MERWRTIPVEVEAVLEGFSDDSLLLSFTDCCNRCNRWDGSTFDIDDDVKTSEFLWEFLDIHEW